MENILLFMRDTVYSIINATESIFKTITDPISNILINMGKSGEGYEILQTMLNSIFDLLKIENMSILELILGGGIPFIIGLAIIKFMKIR